MTDTTNVVFDTNTTDQLNLAPPADAPAPPVPAPVPAPAKLYSFDDHPEHQARLGEWRDKWIANAFSTAPTTDAERERHRDALLKLYTAVGLEPPRHVVFAEGPVSAAVASGIAAGVWYLRDDAQACSLFGREIPEEALCSALVQAVRAFFHAQPVTEECARRVALAAIGRAPIAAVDTTVDTTVNAETHLAVVRFLVECGKRGVNLRNGGNQWSGWVAYISFFRHIAQLPLDYSKWQYYETLAEAGPRFMHAKFAVVSERPTVLTVDEENRAHNPTGPYCVWRDGVELYYWRGTQVPKEWILRPADIDPKQALEHPNAELRRAAAEIVGWGRVMELLKPVVVDTDPDPQMGELLEVQLEGGPCRFLRVLCGTGRTFVLPVPREMQTALQANAWTWGLDDVQYRPEFGT